LSRRSFLAPIAFTRIDSHPGQAFSEVVAAPALDEKDAAMPHVAISAFEPRQRQDEPTSVGQTVEPSVSGSRCASVDVDNIGRFAIDRRAFRLRYAPND